MRRWGWRDLVSKTSAGWDNGVRPRIQSVNWHVSIVRCAVCHYWIVISSRCCTCTELKASTWKRGSANTYIMPIERLRLSGISLGGWLGLSRCIRPPSSCLHFADWCRCCDGCLHPGYYAPATPRRHHIRPHGSSVECHLLRSRLLPSGFLLFFHVSRPLAAPAETIRHTTLLTIVLKWNKMQCKNIVSGFFKMTKSVGVLELSC